MSTAAVRVCLCTAAVRFRAADRKRTVRVLRALSPLPLLLYFLRVHVSDRALLNILRCRPLTTSKTAKLSPAPSPAPSVLAETEAQSNVEEECEKLLP